ncbi:ABC transporter permease [Schinkia azotoformans]|uniref:ABC transporter permease n=1 Tax=Schinkia azotoformans TaxID=1454 RepID=UPI002DBC0345|nr:ABC transporter permease [Schinkia azotoformans]MEC1744258.1 ABC transporter permease [Schinkia azotoformans]MEC1759513.1 ABC transporter permease [Schinkia azotoformans]
MNEENLSKLSIVKLCNPFVLLHFIKSYKSLIIQFSKREILSRYRGSFLGIFWSFINPLIMLTVYTFVFSVVFKGKWGQTLSENKFEFAIILFCGLIAFNIFSETVNRAPSIIIGNVNYVKKVLFPLEILPITILISSLIHALISFVVLLLGLIIFMNTFTWQIILAPILLLPLIFFTLGFSWLLASLGVYIRDVGYTVSLITTVLFYLTPIFYPISAVPDFFQTFMYLNPLTFVIENFRNAVIWGTFSDWSGLVITMIGSLLTLQFGFIWFIKTRKGFADVL